MVGAPYRVAGKTYIPRDNPDYTARGLASWYGEAFHGRLTANGEIYDVEGLTAAHPTMPLPSYARVTNLANGRSIIVRVNDRGPFAHDRVIDLSSKVADVLDFKRQGTARVQVDYVGPARLDGLDDQMLMASYSEGGAPARRQQSRDAIMVAQAPAPRLRPVAATYQQPTYQPQQAPMAIQPGGWETYGDDPLGPLIMRTGFASGYAPETQPTAAQAAIDTIAIRPDLRAALDRAAERRARELGLVPHSTTVVQLGSFGNPDNAARAVHDFAHFGQAVARTKQVNGRDLTVVTVALAPSVSPDAVVQAAAAAGLSGAFVVNH